MGTFDAVIWYGIILAAWIIYTGSRMKRLENLLRVTQQRLTIQETRALTGRQESATP